MVETRLRWFEYVERRLVYYLVRRVYHEGSQITRGRGRHSKSISETFRKDL